MVQSNSVPTNPLNGSDCDALDMALDECGGIREMLARAEQAGLDVSEYKAQLDQVERTARGIKQAFFPNGKPS